MGIFGSKKHIFFCIFFINVCCLYLLSYGQIIRNYQKTPENLYYFGSDFHGLDATGDITLIRQGYEGHPFAFYNITTSIPEKPTIIKIEYILLGRIARILSISPENALLGAKLAISILWFLFLYFLIRRLFHTLHEQLFAMVTILWGSALMEKTSAFAYLEVSDIWTVSRLTLAMPHYLLGGLLSLISLTSLIHSFGNTKRVLLFYVALITAGIASLVYAPSMVLVLASLPFYLVGELILSIRNKTVTSVFVQRCVASLLYVGVGCLPILYVRHIIATELQEFNLAAVEKLASFYRSPRQFIPSLGIPYLLSLFALPMIIKKKQTFFFALYAWVIVFPFSLYVLAPRLELNQVRFYLAPYFVVFGIVSTVGLQTILSYVRHTSVKRILIVLAFCAVIGTSAQSIYISWKRLDVCFCATNYSSFAYPDRDMILGIQWLAEHTKDSDIVLSETYAGVFIPPFAGNRVYTSWWDQLSSTDLFWRQYYKIQSFFAGTVSDSMAKRFLASEDISYIFYGSVERAYNQEKEILDYSTVVEVARFGMVKIYKVIK